MKKLFYKIKATRNDSKIPYPSQQPYPSQHPFTANPGPPNVVFVQPKLGPHSQPMQWYL